MNTQISIDMLDLINSTKEESDLVHFGRYMWYRKNVLPPPATVLDIGCNVYMLECAAIGDVKEGTKFVVPTGYQQYFVGVDCLDRVIKEVEEREIKTIYCEVGWDRLPFADNDFNTVFMGEVLEHMLRERWGFAIEECVRVAKNQVLISVPIKYKHFTPGSVDDPEAHTWEPTWEEFSWEIDRCAGMGNQRECEQILHMPGEPARNIGFNYARIIKKPWW